MIQEKARKEFNVLVKRWSYGHLYIKIWNDVGFETAVSSWQMFEDILSQINKDANDNNYDVQYNFSFET